MQLSVIILNYNVRFFLEQCISSVLKAIADLDAEIIVVDNNSSDDSIAMLREKFPTIICIANKKNFGFPKGNNIGVEVAKGEFLCILNPDTVVAEDTFTKIFNFVTSSAVEMPSLKLGIIGCKLIDGRGNFLPESKRGVPTPFVALTKIFGLYKISNLFGKYYAQHLKENENGKVAILVGAFMVLKREVYLQVGGFDENCFMYSDDIDLSYSVLKLGLDNYYFADTTVIHYKGESTLKDDLYRKRFQDAMQFFYAKHFKTSAVFTFFMKIGSFVFSVAKQFKSDAITHQKINNYIWISNEANSLWKNIIQNKLNIIFENSANYATENTEFIIDLNSIIFSDAIQFLEKKSHSNNTFKFLPPNCQYIIGSNSSNERGKVIKLE
jgi:GT2 family glycosyltransferase